MFKWPLYTYIYVCMCSKYTVRNQTKHFTSVFSSYLRVIFFFKKKEHTFPEIYSIYNPFVEFYLYCCYNVTVVFMAYYHNYKLPTMACHTNTEATLH